MKHLAGKPMLHLLQRVLHFIWQCSHRVWFSCGSTRWSSRSYLESTCSAFDGRPPLFEGLVLVSNGAVITRRRNLRWSIEAVRALWNCQANCSAKSMQWHMGKEPLFSSNGYAVHADIFVFSDRYHPCFRCRCGWDEVVWPWASSSMLGDIWWQC